MKPGDLLRLRKDHTWAPIFALPAPDQVNSRTGTLWPKDVAMAIALHHHMDKLHVLVLSNRMELGWMQVDTVTEASGGWLKSRVLRR